ncbi:uncharacterized protein [Nicotiana tomentosiformis]|uniref:uncharacterized protein n=1 Tax=Nicotiana tomentosiformis TaxID=4098 RepID=UPI00388C8DAE
MGSLAHLEACQRPLAREVRQLASLGVHLSDSNEGGVIVRNRVESSFVIQVKEKQYNDPVLMQLKKGIHIHKTTAFSLGMVDGTLRYQGRLCVPNVDGLRKRIMAGAHTSRYSVKAKHQRPGGLAQSIEIPIWKWEMINIDFVVNISTTFHPRTDRKVERTIQMLEYMLRACVLDLKGSWDDHWPFIEFAYNNSFYASIQMAPFEALYGRRCRLPMGWFEVGEAELIGQDLVHQAMEKVKIIKELLKTAQSRQKSYSDVRRRDLEFEEDDWVVGDPSAIVPVETIEISEELSYEEIPVVILDRHV